MICVSNTNLCLTKLVPSVEKMQIATLTYFVRDGDVAVAAFASEKAAVAFSKAYFNDENARRVMKRT